MKRIKYLVLALSAVMFTACGDDDKLPEIIPTETGMVTDDEGNTYGWVRIGDQDWTTSSAKNGPSCADAQYWNGWKWANCFNAEQKEEFNNVIIPSVGNFMSYEEALKTAPDGWRLPTDEDWQRLEKTLGIGNPNTFGYRGDGVGYKMQESDSGCKLNLKTAGAMTWRIVFGWRELKYQYVDEYGYYWTATKAEEAAQTERAYYRKICSFNGQIERNASASDVYMQVRWVRDAK